MEPMVKTIILSILSILIVVLLIILIVRYRKKDEAFCGTCQGIGNKVCTNRKLLNKMYVDGKLTENSKMIRNLKK